MIDAEAEAKLRKEAEGKRNSHHGQETAPHGEERHRRMTWKTINEEAAGFSRDLLCGVVVCFFLLSHINRKRMIIVIITSSSHRQHTMHMHIISYLIISFF